MRTAALPARRRLETAPQAPGWGTGRARRLHWRPARDILFFGVALPLSIVLLLAASWMLYAVRGLDADLRAIAAYRPAEATLIYGSDGSLLARVAKENRIQVPLERVPRALQDATVTAEDRRFWRHRGVDLRGLARALWRDLRARAPLEGGSTLTMQLVRNVHLSTEKTFERKAREIALALYFERIYSKPRVLEMYLNQVYYGEGAYGVGAAARAYFGKPVSWLTAAQCALLATLPRRPSDFNPRVDPEGARRRRDQLLRRMGDAGMLTPRQVAQALKEPLGVLPSAPKPYRAPGFVDAVLEELRERYGTEAVYSRGLRVHTTVNPTLQEAAEAALERGVKRHRRRGASQGSLVSLDPVNGEVKALVGGIGYQRSSFNRALRARRQPGSAFKPFVYAAAMDLDTSPYDLIEDSRVRLEDPFGPDWQPNNHTGRFQGQTTLVNALAQSLNIPAVKLALRAGLPQVVAIARSCGIQSPLREVPSLALGTSEVTPMELASAYGVFANLGRRAEPRLIRRVTSADGRISDIFDPSMHSVLDAATAQKLDFMLRAVVTGGTARAVASVPRARGKTGTTQANRDAWFAGYTPELVTVVWLGNDRPVRMRGVFGGTGCGPIWREYMLKALRVVPRRPEPPQYVPLRPKPALDPETLMARAPMHPTPYVSGFAPAPATEWAPRTPVGLPAPESQLRMALWEEPPQPPLPSGVRRICMETGDLAGPYCPETRAIRGGGPGGPRGLCILHGAH